MIKRKTRNFEKLVKRLKELNNAKVKSGYFPEQGIHSTAEMPYAELAFIHAKGEGDLPIRDVRPSVLTYLRQPVFNKTLEVNIKAYLSGKVSLDSFLDGFGYRITDIAQSYFGDPDVLAANSAYWAAQKGGNTPLVFEGELRDAWSFKTSVNDTVRGIM